MSERLKTKDECVEDIEKWIINKSGDCTKEEIVEFLSDYTFKVVFEAIDNLKSKNIKMTFEIN